MNYLLNFISACLLWIHPVESRAMVLRSEKCNNFYLTKDRAASIDSCDNDVGAFDNTPNYLCEDQSFSFSDPGSIIPYPNDTLIFVVTTDPDVNNAAAGTFIKMLNTKAVEFDASYMSYGTTYYIMAILGQKNGNGGINFLAGCVQVDGPKPFMFSENPKPDAGLDDHVCGTVYDLNGIQSVIGSQVKWRIVAGSGAAIGDDIAVITQVNTNGQYGTFVFQLTEDNNSCIARDSVSIAFNPAPFISVIDKRCIVQNNTTYPYLAMIRIIDGMSPYTILTGNGVINGNIYTTDTLPSLAFFTVQIQDANGCISNLIIDNYNCNCGMTNAGRLDSSLTIVCKDQCITIKNIESETLDPDELTMYILHQSSWNDTVLPRVDTFYSINDIICFDSTAMFTGLTYYITRVVGKRLLNTNQIDSTNPCIRASNNQPIIWIAYPDANGGRDFKSRSLIAKLNASGVQFGNGFWRLISGPGNVVYDDVTNPKSRVRVDTYGKYCFTWSVDHLGCISVDTVCIEFYKAKWTTPDTPKKAFEDRAHFTIEDNSFPIEIFTPGLISNSGSTFILIYSELNSTINYQWLDICGHSILSQSILVQPEDQKIYINAPLVKGFYFLVLEWNGKSIVQKVCIAN